MAYYSISWGVGWDRTVFQDPELCRQKNYWHMMTMDLLAWVIIDINLTENWQSRYRLRAVFAQTMSLLCLLRPSMVNIQPASEIITLNDPYDAQ